MRDATPLGRARLREVRPDDAPPLPYDEANAEFKQRWDLARDAYSKLLTHAGSLGHPLYATGPASRARAAAASYAAGKALDAMSEAAAQIAECVAIFDRAQRKTGAPDA